MATRAGSVKGAERRPWASAARFTRELQAYETSSASVPNVRDDVIDAARHVLLTGTIGVAPMRPSIATLATEGESVAR